MPTTQPNKTLLRVQKHQSVKSDDMSFKANVYHQNLKVIKKVTHRMSARLYLMLYVIFPIYVNFPNWSRCNLKAIIHRKKTVNCSMLLEKVFFFRKMILMMFQSILAPVHWCPTSHKWAPKPTLNKKNQHSLVMLYQSKSRLPDIRNYNWDLYKNMSVCSEPILYM